MDFVQNLASDVKFKKYIIDIAIDIVCYISIRLIFYVYYL
jgi:hypothetical protein